MAPRRLTNLTTAQRRALAVTLISLVGWSLWNGFREYPHPWGDLSKGKFTDHFSHLNAARVFPRMGLDIWRVPIQEKYRRLTPDELEHQPWDVRAGGSQTGGVFEVPGWPDKKPLAVSWASKTRMYPPGDMLLVAPIAALYHYTDLPLRDACRMLLGWFIGLAHVALYFFFLTYFENRRTAIDWLACFFVYSHVMYWTLEGFYDAAALVPMLLCARYLVRRRGLAAGVAYCVGALIHFRVFFQAPWALYAAALMIKNKLWRDFRWRHAAGIAVAAICGAISLYVFWLDWASLGKVAINNPLKHSAPIVNLPMLWSFKVLFGVCAVAFLLSRAWLDLATLAWLALVTVSLRELYYWHYLVATSWFILPAKRPSDKAVRIAFLLTMLALLFNDTFAPWWLGMLYNASSR